MATDDKFGVLLTVQAWVELDVALKAYIHTGSIGKYLYCKRLRFEGIFVLLTITPEQVNNRIKDEMEIYIPSHFVTFIATVTDENAKKIGFINPD